MSLATFIQASAHSLPMLPDGSVQMIATSPPYYGLRSYAGEQGIEWPAVTFRLNEWVEPTTVPGCDPNCEHEWTDGPVSTQRLRNGEGSDTVKQAFAPMLNPTQGHYCARCGGWRGGLGMEPSPVAYLAHLILCLREWRRVLRDDGVVFCNLGDSYAGGGGYYPDAPSNQNGRSLQSGGNRNGQRNIKGRAASTSGLKPKDLLMIPAMFAIAARADGWFLRSDIIWAKPNPMPESVTDRPTKAHEFIFLLAKEARYFWDADAVREPASESSIERWGGLPPRLGTSKQGTNAGSVKGEFALGINPAGRNLRTVWNVSTSPFPGAHFACWPEKLVEPMIKAGTSERGACPQCGKPWERVTERIQLGERDDTGRTHGHASQRMGKTPVPERGWQAVTNTLAWQPSCTCFGHFEERKVQRSWEARATGTHDTILVYVPDGPQPEPVPCVVLDPFSGSGTTAKVAVRLGRRAIGVDVSAEYLDDVTAQRFGAGVQMELVA